MRFGASILIIASLYYSIKGIIGLCRYKKYGIVLGHSVFIIGYPIILTILINYFKFLELPDMQKFLIVTPVIIFIPVWLMYGFFINKSYENIKMKSVIK